MPTTAKKRMHTRLLTALTFFTRSMRPAAKFWATMLPTAVCMEEVTTLTRELSLAPMPVTLEAATPKVLTKELTTIMEMVMEALMMTRGVPSFKMTFRVGP